VGERLRRLVFPLVLVEVVVVCALGALAWHATQGGTLERAINSAVYARPGTVVRSITAAVTLTGSPVAATIGTLVVAAATWWRFRDLPLALFSPVAVAGSATIESIVKRVVSRSRPSTAVISHLTERSFPSGHTTLSTALAFSAILLVWAGAFSARRRSTTAALVVYAVAVGASRLVLGVHYLTDVVGGAAIGTGVVLALSVWWTVTNPPTTPAVIQA